MAMIEGAGVELHFEARGQGPPVLLVHGLAADAAGFEPLAAGLADEARTIAYDRRGYGASGAPEPYTATTVAEQAEDLAALVRAADARGAVACAEGFGALVVIDVLRRHPGTLSAAVLVDPPVFQFVPEALEPLAAERAMLEEALRSGGPEEAVEAWLSARGITDPARVAAARRDVSGFFADYAGQATLELARRDLRAIDVPVAVVSSPGAPAHVRAAADAILALVPGGRACDSAGAALADLV
jgi:pimeloyl-ACP methyl ester carboxylesterase